LATLVINSFSRLSVRKTKSHHPYFPDNDFFQIFERNLKKPLSARQNNDDKANANNSDSRFDLPVTRPVFNFLIAAIY
jgi:hypothetical protein